VVVVGVLASWIAWLLVQVPTRSRRSSARWPHSPRLRGTVDLETVQGDLVEVVHQAFEPAHVSMWLPSRTSTGRPG
jgi:hypothetical protein